MIHQTSDIILGVQASPIPWGRFRAEFLALYQPPLAAPATLAKLDQVIRICEGLGVASTADLTPETVAAFLGSRPPGQSPWTARSLLMQLRTVCSYAEERRYLQVSPFRVKRLSRWVRVPASPGGKRHQSREELRRIFAALEAGVATGQGWSRWRAQRLHAAVATAAMTAVRKRECFTLFVEDVDLDDRVINLVPRPARLPAEGDPAGDAPRFKTEASAQPVAMPPALVPILRAWLAHRLEHPAGMTIPPPDRIPWLFPGAYRVSAWVGGNAKSRPLGQLQAVARAAGVEGVTFQSLRRSWCTLAEALGLPQALITRQARHTSEQTTRKYYQQRDLDALRDALEGFEL